MARRSTPGSPVRTEKRNVRRRGRARGKWVDVSVPLRTGMVHWPSDPPVEIERTRAMERGDSSNLSFMSMGSHSGTHMDAPAHFVPGGRGIDEMPVEATIGRARVIEIKDRKSIKPRELESHRIRRGERVLFRTRNSEAVWGGGPFA